VVDGTQEGDEVRGPHEAADVRHHDPIAGHGVAP
jgi:hypothetical protein